MAEASTDKLAFELVSPERVLSSVHADMVVVPGEEGDFGVLVEHAPLLSLLRPGVISIYQGQQVADRIFVEGGFAEVNPKGLIVLAEAAAPMGELNLDDARQQLKDAEEDLGDAKDPTEPERERLERAIVVARARIEALEFQG